MPKILAIPDLHCFYDNYSRIGEDGTPSRLADFRLTADALIDLAIQESVNLAVAPGDYFVNPRPAPRAEIEVARLFYRFEEAGIKVVGCNGNHDTPGPGQPGPVDVISSLGLERWGVTSPQVVRAGGLQVAVLPWAKPSGLVENASSQADAIQQTVETLLAIARSLGAELDQNVPSILIGHWAVSGCQTSSGQQLFGEEPTLPLSELQALPFQAVIMGHIHKPQHWTSQGEPPVIHTGALERRDFGEENDLRGAYIVDLGTGGVTWHDLPARRFATVDMKDPWDPDKVKGAIVRVTYRATEEEARTKYDHQEIRNLIEQMEPHLFAGIFPDITRGERGREATVTETTGPLEALEKWLSLHPDLSPAVRQAVQFEAQALLKEVQSQ